MSAALALLEPESLQSPTQDFEQRRNMCPVRLGPAGDMTLTYTYQVGPEGVLEEDLLFRVNVNGGKSDVKVSGRPMERGLPDAFADALVLSPPPEAELNRTLTLPVRLGDSVAFLRIPVERDESGECHPAEHAVLVQLRQARGNPNECVVSGQFFRVATPVVMEEAEVPCPVKAQSRDNRGRRLAA